MGAWIEIKLLDALEPDDKVAPYMGAWIEIESYTTKYVDYNTSHPTWVRGLK